MKVEALGATNHAVVGVFDLKQQVYHQENAENEKKAGCSIDMDAVWDGVFNASGDFDTADKYVEELADEISKMKAFPRSGIPLVYNGLFVGYYSVIYKAYRAFYRIQGEYTLRC